MCAQDNLDLVLQAIETENPTLQKYAFWIMGYLALKFRSHETVAQRTSYIGDDEEEVNMMEDEQPKIEDKILLKDFKEEKETPIYLNCF